MRKLLAVFVALAVATAFSSAALAKGPMKMKGEVTKLTEKAISVKDEKGKEHHFSITKKTKKEGEIAVGTTVEIEHVGKYAHMIKAEAAAPAPAAPAAPAPTPAPEKK